ncbi:MarR family winged helix-turn-helix transcriptional regulator [Ulvibacterium sp.]|uniref:MarR family winged helix-turn-helix transcriptional regulator n=1 Tax=Ulvibacterium sp. TaxID=2665914 RepID=UPI00262B10C3|nr:MarR family transcriptional regulator [Ulvibacterium sp.]
MEAFNLVKELVLLVDDFKKESLGTATDIDTFLEWLGSKRDFPSQQENYNITGHSLEVEIAAYIGRMGRYGNTYIKKTLEGLPFSTDMEFTFTAILDRAGEVGKTDLIRMMAYDKSSGMGVIKRLLKNGIIEEFPNPQDKRGKLLRLTKKGRENVRIAYRKVPKAAHLVTKELHVGEKRRLLRLLKKMDDFHYPIYLNEILPADLRQDDF